MERHNRRRPVGPLYITSLLSPLLPPALLLGFFFVCLFCIIFISGTKISSSPSQIPSLLLDLTQILPMYIPCCCCFFGWAACGVSVPQPGIQPRALGKLKWSPDHWTIREFQCILLFKDIYLFFKDILNRTYFVLREGNGNPLQYSCLENPMDGRAWWATVHGVTKNQT